VPDEEPTGLNAIPPLPLPAPPARKPLGPPIADSLDEEPTGLIPLADLQAPLRAKPGPPIAASGDEQTGPGNPPEPKPRPAMPEAEEISTGVVGLPPGALEALAATQGPGVGPGKGSASALDASTSRKPLSPREHAEAMKAGHRLGFEIAVGAIMLIGALAAGAGYVWGGPSHPSESELAMLYPYGKTGGRMPNGRTAPSMSEVTFTLMQQEDCSGEPCLRYSVTQPGTAFGIQMVVERHDSAWRLVSQSDGPR
jgi:hypothetical protein